MDEKLRGIARAKPGAKCEIPIEGNKRSKRLRKKCSFSFEKNILQRGAAWIEMRSLHSGRKNALKTKRVNKFVG